MITKRIILMLSALILLAHFPKHTTARPITYYQYFTKWEITRFNEIIWFWSPDTMYGPARSNDYIGIKLSPQFYGPLITSKERFFELNANPHFAMEPIFNAPSVNLPQSYPRILARANAWIDSDGGQNMTRLILRDGDLQVFQYSLGGNQENLRHVETISPLENTTVVVDGMAEIAGELTGTLTIYATDDIYLIDDIRYVNSNDQGRWDDEDDPGGMLGIVSEGDILIKDNWANGRHNRAQGSSIVINASLIALGESFTIEHQNDDWDAYQGTDPDERGYIILTGSIAQWRRGYVHRSNHTGTGYGKSYHYDFRLEFSGPPGFGADFTGHYNHLRLESGVSQLVGVTANRLTIDAGAQIIFDGDSALTVQGNIDLNGTAENPIIFTTLERDSANILIAVSDENSHVNFSHVIFDGNIKVSLNSGTIDISNSNFAQDVSFEGNLQVESSVFSGEVSLTSFEILTVRHSVFTKGVTIDGNTEDGRFINNTVVGAHREGLLLNQFRSLRIVNNIIFANEWGIVNHDQESPILLYNDVFGSGQDDYIDCNAGEGSISEDPLFVNFDEGDYELVWDSPCVDTGDPASPIDLDYSRSDMGAIAIKHWLSVPENSILPNEFRVSAFPNPFNDVVKINILSPLRGNAEISIFDIQGRGIMSRNINLELGKNSIELNGNTLNSSGVYLLNVNIEEQSSIIKLVYMP